ncbi:MAG: homocysteine biosynthesis protein [Candidatus Hermodarchaeota archaeon]
MGKATKTVEEINKRIDDGSVKVVTATEMIDLVAELGSEKAVEDVDVVTTGTFGAMCSSGVWLNFGHSEPPIKMSRVWLNDVEAYGGVAAVDAYLGATQPSKSYGIDYGGGHVIEDLVSGKSVSLRAEAYGTDCYPRKQLMTEIALSDVNQAIMSNPRNGYQKYIVATNSTNKVLYTYLGKLLPNMGNATYSGAGELAPIPNDPNFQTIGVGTRIFLGGAQGYVIGSGTQHNPKSGFGTLMVQGNLKDMSPEFIRGATFENYGCTLYVGIGIPIPILNADIAKNTAISDEEIVTSVLDYGVPSRARPVLRNVSYAQLRSGTIEINGQEVRTASVSSYSVAKKIADLLKKQIQEGSFSLTQAVHPLSQEGSAKPMVQKSPVQTKIVMREKLIVPEGQYVYKNDKTCVNCGLCLSYCPADVYTYDTDWHILVDPSKCIQCGQCRDVCPHKAISLSD